MSRVLFSIFSVLYLSFSVLSLSIFAADLHVEKWYQQRVCDSLGGEMEVVTTSGTRCDCLNGTYAIEFDFGHKWAESIGQSLDYSAHLNRVPGVVLILEGEEDNKFLDELLYVNKEKNLGIKVWAVFPVGKDVVKFKEVN